MLARNFLSACFRIASLSFANNEYGASRPNSVIVWKPCSRNSGDRMLSSVRVWQ